MAENDIIVAKEGSGGTLSEIALAPSDIGAANASHTHTAADIDSGASAAGTFLQSNGSGVAGWNTVSYEDLDDVPSTFAPSTHASTHATGGSDAIAPSDIGAQSIFENIAVGPISADTTLTASRAARYRILNFSGARTVTLPTTNTQLGDVAIVSAITTTGDITIQASNGAGGFITLATITTGGGSGEIFRFYVAFESGQQWLLDRLQTHTHPASDITSGTLTHERGGLEADVSAYDGLLKISGGSTSAVTVTTAGEALLDDADAAAQRTTLGLGNSATLDTGTTAGTVAAGDHTHELNALDATGATDGHVLTADGAGGAAWEALPSTALNDLSNVSAAAPSDNDVLVYDNATSTWVAEAPAALPIEYVIACSDESSDLTTGTAKVTFRAPVAFLLTGVAASVNTAPTGSTIIVDINNGANSALSTKLSIDASEKTSATAATAAVIDTSYDDFAADAEITIDIDQIGSTVAGKGLKVTLIGTRA